MNPRPERAVQAAEGVLRALRTAQGDDPASVAPVVERLDELQRVLAEGELDPLHHAPVRAAIDAALLGMGALLNDLCNARDEAGRGLARLRSGRRGDLDARGAGRLDLIR